MKRVRTAAYWIAPLLFCLVLYRQGLKSWFLLDDFSLLRLDSQVHGWHDFWKALFAPIAQGTIRPWSERVPFMAFYALFGLRALPFRAWVFLTQFANLILIASLTRRVTGSALAGFWAPILWIASSGMYWVMSWTAIYAHVQCSFFLLLAFHFLLRFIETGRSRYNVCQWAVFLLGFGALEINVVYPALAACYTLLCARPYSRRTLPLFVPSVAFAVLHTIAVPKPSSGVYAKVFDFSVLRTLWTYWQWALGPSQLSMVVLLPSWTVILGTAGLTAAVAGFALRRTWRGDWLPLFFLLWFGITIAPVLLLRNHVIEYYLTIPTIGLAMLGGWGLACAWQAGWAWKTVAVAAAAAYFAASLPVASVGTKYWYDLSRGAKTMVLGVVRAHQLHPNKVILLSGMDSSLFWTAFFHRPFLLFDTPDVYLVPGSESRIEPHPELGKVDGYVFSAPATAQGLERGQVVIYKIAGGALQDITGAYGLPVGYMLDVADPRAAAQLVEGWYGVEYDAWRWTKRKFSVLLHPPDGAAQRGALLQLAFTAPDAVISKLQSISLSAAVDGVALHPQAYTHAGEFVYSSDVPAKLLTGETVKVEFTLDKALLPSNRDLRELGVIVTRVGFRTR